MTVVYSSIMIPLCPTEEQKKTFNIWMYRARTVYNACTEQRRTYNRHYFHKYKTSRYSQGAEVKNLRKIFPEIKEVPAEAIHSVIADVDKAWEKFYSDLVARKEKNREKKGKNGKKTKTVVTSPTEDENDGPTIIEEPGFKKHGEQNLRFYYWRGLEMINAKYGKINIPKMGFVKFKHSGSVRDGEWNEVHRNKKGVEKTAWRYVTVSQKAGRWYLSIVRLMEKKFYSPPAEEVVGIDRGVVISAALSKPINGQEFFTMPSSTKDLLLQIDRVNQKLSAQKRGSARYKKTRLKKQKLEARLANIRENFNHNLSNNIVNNFGTVVLENLNVKNMTKRAKKKYVSRKAKLNRSILNSNWGQLKTFLKYKTEQRGSELIFVNPAYTSQACSCCGTIDKTNRVSQSRYFCQDCETDINADLNAARNIEHLGMLQLQSR